MPRRALGKNAQGAEIVVNNSLKRTQLCVGCSRSFTYVSGQGLNRLYCTKRCWRERVNARQRATLNRTRTKTCAQCSKSFSYNIKSGADRVYCSADCIRRAGAESRAQKRQLATKPCSTPECSGTVVFRHSAGLCEACYLFAWKTGRARDPKRKPYQLRDVKRGRGNNYRVLRVPGHPLANKSGDVYHHRLVAYSARAGICGACYWCAIPLDWDLAKIDHLNDDKSDNRPENLVTACNNCNRWRGSLATFLERLEPGRIEEVIALCRAHVRAEGKVREA